MFASGDLLRSVLKDQISKTLVYPNKIDIKIKDGSKSTAVERIKGGFHVLIESFDDFDEFDGLSATGTVQLGKQIFHLPEFEVIKGSKNLNFHSEFLDFGGEKRKIEVFLEIEKDTGLSKKFKCVLDVEKMTNEENLDGKYKMIPSGYITVSITLFTLSSNRKELNGEKKKSSALLEVFTDSFIKLPENRKNIFLKLSVSNQHQESTANKKNKIKKSFFFFLSNPEAEILNIQVVDQSTKKEFAKFAFQISLLTSSNNMEHKLQAFSFDNIDECEILMSLKMFAIQTTK